MLLPVDALPALALLLSQKRPTANAAVTGCARPAPPDPEFINLTESSPYPFSSAVRAGDLLYLSGQIGTKVEDGKSVLVPGGIEAETRQTFANIKATLEKAGLSLDRVVKCTVMMADMTEWPKMKLRPATTARA